MTTTTADAHSDSHPDSIASARKQTIDNNELGHPTHPAHQDLEYRYYQYLRAQSYITEAALLDVLRYYLPYFQGFTRVLDIGCGHGEFLQLLAAAGHEAVGIDIDPAMVQTCMTNGLTAIEADATAWLATQEAQFDAIFSSNVIEHMDAPSVQALIHNAFRALRPGGLLLLGTPNPESLIVQFHEFWRDPTHVRLYDRQLLEFFFADAGFVAIQNGNNGAAAWTGVDQMTDPNIYAAPQIAPFAEAVPPPALDTMTSELHPLPQPPVATAPLRQRLAFRLLNVVYQKFLEPYVALLRHDLAQLHHNLTEQRAYSETLYRYAQQLHHENQQLAHTLQTTIHQQEGRFEQIGYGFKFLYPSREFFVYGHRPPHDANSLAQAAPASATAAAQIDDVVDHAANAPTEQDGVTGNTTIDQQV